MSAIKHKTAKTKRQHQQRGGTARSQHPFANRFDAWRANHLSVARDSFARLTATPFSSAITILVLAIALALPATLVVAIKNIERLSGQTNDTVQVSLYLQQHVNPEVAQSLATVIADWPDVATVETITADQALASFKADSGYADVINQLETNPLPGVITITVDQQSLNSETLTALQRRALQLDEVAQANIDLAWLEKVRAITDFARQLSHGLIVLLAIGVVLVVGNTTRQAIDNRREEIIVTKLVGATHAFIRRPFLYMGLWLGLAAAAITLILLAVAMMALSDSVSSLSSAYNTSIQLEGLGLDQGLLLVAMSTGLGWLGAWLVSSQHIRSLEPQ